MSKLKSIAVFCGSSHGNQQIYTDEAKQFVRAMHARELDLIYGGGDVGIMKTIADEMLSLGGKVIGVMPKKLVDVEIAHKNLTELQVVPSMSRRKELIEEISDSFVMLPGGVGSLDEFFEMFTLAQLGYHNKPCAILNTDGYYDELIAFMDKAVDKGFVHPANREMILIEKSIEALLDQLEKYTPTTHVKWQ